MKMKDCVHFVVSLLLTFRHRCSNILLFLTNKIIQNSQNIFFFVRRTTIPHTKLMESCWRRMAVRKLRRKTCLKLESCHKKSVACRRHLASCHSCRFPSAQRCCRTCSCSWPTLRPRPCSSCWPRTRTSSTTALG